MLPRQSRLTREQDFARVYRKGRRLSSAYLSVFVLPTKAEFSRFGFVVGKKQAAKIVDRNRVKRVLRAASRAYAKAIPSVEIIIQAKSGIARQKPHRIREEFRFLMEKLKNQ